MFEIRAILFFAVDHKTPQVKLMVGAAHPDSCAVESPCFSFQTFEISSEMFRSTIVMYFQHFLLLIGIWNSQATTCRPENLFLDSINQPIGNDVDLFSTEGSGDFLDESLNPSDLALSPDLTSGEYNTDTSTIDPKDLFFTEDLSAESIPLLQSSTPCGTDVGLTMMNEDFPQLQARDNPSCASSPKPNENIDSILNLFKDPEGWLRKKIPATKPATGQVNQPGQDDENINLESLSNRKPIPGLFEDDDQTCPPQVFDLSVIPVCHASIRGSRIDYPGGWSDLSRVEPCMPLFITFYDRTFTPSSILIPCDRCSEQSCMFSWRNTLVL